MNKPQKTKFRVHTYQVVCVPYEVEAESPEQAARLVHDDGGEKYDPSGESDNIGLWQPDSSVDPLLPNGEVDYENACVIDLRSAQDMRNEALALLKKAEEVDGLKPYAIVHEHEYGASTYIGWCEREPTEEQAIAILDNNDVDFEEDRGENLTICELTVDEMCGADPASVIKAEKTARKVKP